MVYQGRGLSHVILRWKNLYAGIVVYFTCLPPPTPIISQTTGRSKNSDSKRNKYGAPSKTNMLNIKKWWFGSMFFPCPFSGHFLLRFFSFQECTFRMISVTSFAVALGFFLLPLPGYLQHDRFHHVLSSEVPGSRGLRPLKVRWSCENLQKNDVFTYNVLPF